MRDIFNFMLCQHYYRSTSFLFAALQYILERFVNTWKGLSDHKIAKNFISSVYALQISRWSTPPLKPIINSYNTIWSAHRESSLSLIVGHRCHLPSERCLNHLKYFFVQAIRVWSLNNFRCILNNIRSIIHNIRYTRNYRVKRWNFEVFRKHFVK